MNESTPDTPIVILKQNRRKAKWTIGFNVVVVAYALYHVAAVIYTGTLAVGIASDQTLPKQIFLFLGELYLAPLFSLALVVGFRKHGDFKFYQDRLEFESFWFNWKVSIPYEKMHVRIGQIRAVVTDSNWPTWKTPKMYIRVLINDLVIPSGIFFNDRIIGNFTYGFSNRYLNPQDGPKAIQILKEKAFSIEY